MPLLILAALVVIVLMLYIALGGKEGAPTINLNKILDFISPKAPADKDAQDAGASEPKATENTNPGASANAEAPKEAAAEKTPAAAEETPVAAGEKSAVAEEQTESAKDAGAPDSAAFASMEELTEFYRKEAERLTGIKH
ncbi:MAG: hypothetical protein LBS24_02785 [Clostridiales Family XIII bacterium]|jgi:hypothetical protein|nr:hypothetical protein [Clostridiales Family XIII bacterium]